MVQSYYWYFVTRPLMLRAMYSKLKVVFAALMFAAGCNQGASESSTKATAEAGKQVDKQASQGQGNDKATAAKSAAGAAQPGQAGDVAASGAGSANIPGHLASALAAQGRPEADRGRDSARRPGEVLAFFGIAPGMQVAELMAGSGYYAEILARAVGDKGTVFAQNTKWVLDRFANEPLTKRLANPELSNITRVDRELEDIGLPEGQLDAALMMLFYHDTFWLKTDRAAMNQQILSSLKPGGIYGIIDHHAKPGSGEEVTKSIHRIDAEVVKNEIVAAGFELVESSDLLRHPDDARTVSVFDEEIRGKTDRFIYKFKKPAQ